MVCTDRGLLPQLCPSIPSPLLSTSGFRAPRIAGGPPPAPSGDSDEENERLRGILGLAGVPLAHRSV